jgi:hypothetical protein
MKTTQKEDYKEPEDGEGTEGKKYNFAGRKGTLWYPIAHATKPFENWSDDVQGYGISTRLLTRFIPHRNNQSHNRYEQSLETTKQESTDKNSTKVGTYCHAHL